MIGADLSSSERALPPLAPLSPQHLTAGADELERRVLGATESMGMTRWFWGEGVCLLAAVRLSRARHEPVAGWVLDFVFRHAESTPVIEHVNNLAPGATVAELFLQDQDPRFRRLVEACLEWFEGSPLATRDPNGALEHWPGGVWADTVYMAGQFLLRAGRALEREDLIDEAGRQWLRHAQLLQDEDSGLIAHGTHAGQRIPSHWGRANAWFALAGTDLAVSDTAGAEEIRERLAAQFHALARFQPPHGVWDVLVDDEPETRGIVETSAAAGIGAAMVRASEILASDAIRDAGKKAICGSLSYIDADGWLRRVSAGTIVQLIPFGYSVIRDDHPQPWGQGLALEALAAWRHIGEEQL